MFTNHRSIRKFKDQPVSEDLINEIPAAAMNALSAGNQQPYPPQVDCKKLQSGEQSI
ncbi:nitroreductase family protein [Candidatus Desulfatibia sp.]|uniref:nitroreductase family protein n=1 Tax=Candidatus Desulfatibia sp. TaxID=3101189 RepID=UPI0039B8C1FA